MAVFQLVLLGLAICTQNGRSECDPTERQEEMYTIELIAWWSFTFLIRLIWSHERWCRVAERSTSVCVRGVVVAMHGQGDVWGFCRLWTPGRSRSTACWSAFSETEQVKGKGECGWEKGRGLSSEEAWRRNSKNPVCEGEEEEEEEEEERR